MNRARGQIRLALWAVVAVLAASGAARAEVLVRGFRVWQGPRYVRLVLDLSGPTSYRMFTLPAPARFVVDLRDTDLATSLALPSADAIVRDLRAGRRSDGSERIVADLRTSARFHVFLLKPYPPYGYRLVIDLRTGRAAGTLPVRHRRAANRPLVIAIDPGHGGDDPGAIGVDHIEEKNVVLAIARDLNRMINATPGMSSFLTRKGDYYVPLRRRFEIATQHDADAFVSIHADSLPGIDGRTATGSSIYILSSRGATREAAYLARSENASDFIGGATTDLGRNNTVLNHVLVDMSQTGTIAASHQLASDILGELAKAGPVHTDHVDRAAFMVLSSPEIPSVLIETEFISNPYEAHRLADPRFQHVLAYRIWKGIMRDAPALRARRAPVTPPPAHVREAEYTVRPGETLDAIAKRYHVDVRALRATNGLRGNRVSAGLHLLIPRRRTQS
ncbi:MAG: N-acetylmuramoyl-L-alanine amidase [Acidiferrobacteraceae bacterium]